MAKVYADRVMEASTSTGTGDMALDGAVVGFQSFGSALTVGDEVSYSIFAVDSTGAPTGAWETGAGSYSASNILTRTTPAESSNAGAAVSFGAGTKYVMLSFNADDVGGGGGGGGAPWQLFFKPTDNEPPIANFPALAVRNNRPILAFDGSTQEVAVFFGVLPAGYGGGGIAVTIAAALDIATSGTLGWDVAIERIEANSTDLDADDFATAQTVTAVTVPGTAGFVLYSTVNISDGTDMGDLAAGEAFRLRLRRDVANDTASGDAHMVAVSVKEQ